MKLLLASTAILSLTSGIAMAEITLSGDARMGIIDNFGADNTGFTSRARVKFTLSGETDTGLSFGASFRADNAADAKNGDAGEVFVSGAFGKLTMGDIDGAAEQAVGNVDGVGLTGLGDLNEGFYLHDFLDSALTDPSAAYEYSAGGFTGIVSVQNPDNQVGPDVDPTYALGLKYAFGDYTVSLGYETNNDIDADNIVIGATATMGAVALKADYGRLSGGGQDYDSYHVSATYTADALALTAFYSNEDDIFNDGGPGASGYGLGASYDLGGGAKVVGGYVKDESVDANAFDLGLSFSF